MELQDHRRAYEIERHRLQRINHKSNTDLVIIVFGSIFGFLILFALLVYITSPSQ
jgi:hypothetical protein